jgi:hypothetical protein
LIVWGEAPSPLVGPGITTSVRAARIDGDGKLLDQEALIIDSMAYETQPKYDVAASGDRFAVAYSGDSGLQVRTVGRDGTLGNRVALDAFLGSSSATLRIAASNDGSRFLVVWSDAAYKAALLDRNLNVLGTNIDLGTGTAFPSAFALVPRGDGFALIARSDDAKIFARTVDANADVTGELTLATDIPGYSSIDAAASGDPISIITGPIEIEWAAAGIVVNRAFSGNELLSVTESAVASTDSRGISVYDLSSPSSRTATIEVRPPHSAFAAAIVRITNGTYTAFITDDGFEQTDLFGALNSGPIDIVAGSPSYQMAPTIASDAAGESLVVWREYSTRSRVWQLLGRIVDRAGVPIGAVTVLSSQNPYTAYDLTSNPHVTSDGTRFLVTYGLNTIRGQFVSSGGALIGEPFVITQTAFTFLDYSGEHDATWDGQHYLVTWVEGAGGRFVREQHVVGAFVGNDGVVGSPFRITSGEAAYYSQASSPAGDTLLTTFAANGFASYIVHSDGAIDALIGGPYFAVAPGATVPVVAWGGSAFVAAWSDGTGVIQPDGSTTVRPPSGLAMSPRSAMSNASGVMVTGVTQEGVAVLQLDPASQPIGGPVIVARGAASPAASETGVLVYTRADDRDITRIFVQRPASIIRHRAATH